MTEDDEPETLVEQPMIAISSRSIKHEKKPMHSYLTVTSIECHQMHTTRTSSAAQKIPRELDFASSSDQALVSYCAEECKDKICDSTT